MTKKKEQQINSAELRRRAEKRLGEKTGTANLPKAEGDPLRLQHELQVHQIELEMQNAELRKVRDKLEDLLAESEESYIAGQKISTKKLLTSERNLRMVIEKNVDGLIVVDAGGILRFMNPAAETLFGGFAESLIGKPIGLPLFSEEAEEIDVSAKDGTQRTVEMRTASIHWEEKEALLVSLRDITERKRMQEELREHTETLEKKVSERTKQLKDLNGKLQLTNKELMLRRQEADDAKLLAEEATRAKSDFLANMSHELRTPLNSIIGFSEILEDGIAGPIADNQKELANDIATSGKYLLSLINDILDLSKVEAGKMKLELSEFNIEYLIDGSLVMFREKALKQHIELSAQVEEGIGGIEADERKIKQILFNLLSNAIKFTPDGGSVSVAARQMVRDAGAIPRVAHDEGRGSASPLQERDFVEISVTDTGIGISPEDQKKLFQPFKQIDSALSRKYAGTGLGLSLCKGFVALHGGTIRIESEEGKGSTFTFTIPSQAELSTSR